MFPFPSSRTSTWVPDDTTSNHSLQTSMVQNPTHKIPNENSYMYIPAVRSPPSQAQRVWHHSTISSSANRENLLQYSQPVATEKSKYIHVYKKTIEGSRTRLPKLGMRNCPNIHVVGYTLLANMRYFDFPCVLEHITQVQRGDFCCVG